MPSNKQDPPPPPGNSSEGWERTSDEIIRLIEEADRDERSAQTYAFLIVIAASAIALGVTGGMFVIESVLLTAVVFFAVFYLAARVLLRLFV